MVGRRSSFGGAAGVRQATGNVISLLTSVRSAFVSAGADHPARSLPCPMLARAQDDLGCATKVPVSQEQGSPGNGERATLVEYT